jgi:hypothetical protein
MYERLLVLPSVEDATCMLELATTRPKFFIHEYQENFIITILQKMLGATIKISGTMANW